MRKKSHERKTQCCSRVRSQQKMVGGMGRVDGDMVWQELAEVELEDGPGLLEVGGCNFCWNNSLFFLPSCPSVSPTIPSSPCDGRTRGRWCTPTTYQGASVYLQLMGPMPLLSSPSSPSRCGLFWASGCGWGLRFFFLCLPLSPPHVARNSQWRQRHSQWQVQPRSKPQGLNCSAIAQNWSYRNSTNIAGLKCNLDLIWYLPSPSCYWLKHYSNAMQ